MKEYSIILADPPWAYKVWAKKAWDARQKTTTPPCTSKTFRLCQWAGWRQKTVRCFMGHNAYAAGSLFCH